MEQESGSSKNSPKHSSTTRKMPRSPQKRAISSTVSRLSASPVGLLGLQKNARSGFHASASPIHSSRSKANPRSSRSAHRRTLVPQTARACSYSEKEGAVTRARPGLLASASWKIRSAAPFPQIISSLSTP